MPRLRYSFQIIGDSKKQQGQVGLPLTKPLQVKVTDAETGEPAYRIPVTFRVVKGKGDFEDQDTQTDIQGVAVAEFVPDKPGPFHIVCRIGDGEDARNVHFQGKAVRHLGAADEDPPAAAEDGQTAPSGAAADGANAAGEPLVVTVQTTVSATIQPAANEPLICRTPSLMEEMEAAKARQAAAGSSPEQPAPAETPAASPAVQAAGEAPDSNVQAALEADQALDAVEPAVEQAAAATAVSAAGPVTVTPTGTAAAMATSPLDAVPPPEIPILIPAAAKPAAAAADPGPLPTTPRPVPIAIPAPAADPASPSADSEPPPEEEPLKAPARLSWETKITLLGLAVLVSAIIALAVRFSDAPAPKTAPAKPVVVHTHRTVDCSGVKPKTVGNTWVFENCPVKQP